MSDGFLTALLLLPLAVIANWQLVETWHHGSIFERPRAWFEARGDLLSDLLGCPFCLSHWTGLLCTLLAYLATRGLTWPCAADGYWPLYWLALVRLAQLCNDLTHRYCRTPRLDADLAQAIEDELNRNAQ